MSSSSSAIGLNRTRSLRQPTAGPGSAPKKDEAKRNLETRHKAAVASASASTTNTSGTMSPSRLPKLGASTTAAAHARPGPSGAGIGTATTSAEGTRSRPTSGISGVSRLDTVTARQPPTQSVVRDGGDSSKTTRRIPTSATRMARPKSMIVASKSLPLSSARPSSSISTNLPSPSTATPQSPRRNTHTRAKSTATSLTSTTTLRPPRPPSAGSTGSATTTATTASAARKRQLGPTNTVTTRAVSQRQTATASNANTSVISTATSTLSRPATRPPSKQTSTAGDAARNKPAFNTLQQHYSPARNLAPKPLTSSYLAPPTPSKLPANIILSSETVKLQTELLQLHLLHRDADAATAAWHASAKERLGRRFEELVQADAEAGKEEAAAEEARNLAALKAWASNGNGKSLDDRIQILDGVLTGLWSLSEPGGRHARVVRKFEKWVAQMLAAVEARRKAGGLGALKNGDEVTFIGELDPAWKEEVSSIARKLDEWRRHLTHLQLGLPIQADRESQTSSLAKILAGCWSQVHDILAELDTMDEIERSALNDEAAWVKRMNQENAEDDTPGAGAVWRAF